MAREALCAAEKAAGTDLAAILELMADWMGEEIGRRIRQEWQARDRRRRSRCSWREPTADRP